MIDRERSCLLVAHNSAFVVLSLNDAIIRVFLLLFLSNPPNNVHIERSIFDGFVTLTKVVAVYAAHFDAGAGRFRKRKALCLWHVWPKSSAIGALAHQIIISNYFVGRCNLKLRLRFQQCRQPVCGTMKIATLDCGWPDDDDEENDKTVQHIHTHTHIWSINNWSGCLFYYNPDESHIRMHFSPCAHCYALYVRKAQHLLFCFCFSSFRCCYPHLTLSSGHSVSPKSAERPR